MRGQKKQPDLAMGIFYGQDPRTICQNSKLILSSEKGEYECLGHARGDAFYPTFHGVPQSNTEARFRIVPSSQKRRQEGEYHSNPCTNFTKKDDVYICKGHMLSFHSDGTQENEFLTENLGQKNTVCSDCLEIKPGVKYKCQGHEFGDFKSPSFHGSA